MKLDFHVWLKFAIVRFLDRKIARKPEDELLSRDEERELSAREYELYYWGTAPGLWY
ncbi:hypothetical protein [Rhizobium sp. Nf11,1]|uniref:hypothetical protein n=1 Tax=Rhizobium sp. Nf11,1 TaxID=3404923 RepID=UPI003D33F5FE